VYAQPQGDAALPRRYQLEDDALAGAADARDAAAAQPGCVDAQLRVEYLQAPDPHAGDRSIQLAGDGFDFGKLRHARAYS
jgi:hypothetical protein